MAYALELINDTGANQYYIRKFGPNQRLEIRIESIRIIIEDRLL